MEHRLAELEIRVNLAEDLVEELNLTVYRQQQQIDLLQQQLRHLYQQVRDEPATAEKSDPHDDLPPHY
ncbi:SlyX family protein [Accumulibacter sp.]|uniref:SlyX family protein n=1 Tax=Accumulibacter sp. TaxID=2053492 RepID=UPI0028C3B994|nr:SlyX family protein [Accumulibacter sp.]